MILRAIEEKRFLPVGADRETQSSFQLVAGTNRDLARAVAEGRFREDLLARLNLWTFELPGLRARREDIEPNLDFELQRHAEREGTSASFNREARQRYLAFAISPEALWNANFRDLGASVTRMATLSPRGRITEEIVREEIEVLRRLWAPAGPGTGEAGLLAVLPAEALAGLDLFDRVQLAEVVRICRESRSLSEAGRRLFAVSRTTRTTTNDADRLKKYLARFGLDWPSVTTG